MRSSDTGFSSVGLSKGAGAMALQLRALAGFPPPPWQFITVCNSSSDGSDALFWPPRELHAHGAQACMQIKHPQT